MWLNKWIWQDFVITIETDVKKLLKWIWQNYTNGCNKTKQMDLTRLYKSKW